MSKAFRVTHTGTGESYNLVTINEVAARKSVHVHFGWPMDEITAEPITLAEALDEVSA